MHKHKHNVVVTRFKGTGTPNILQNLAMTPALDPKQGSFKKRRNYNGSWKDTASLEKPKKGKPKFPYRQL